MAALLADGATDPSAAADVVAWHNLGGAGVLLLGGGVLQPLPGTHPALGGGKLAVREPGVVRVLDRASMAELVVVPDTSTGALAVSDTHLVTRVRQGDTDRLESLDLLSGERRVLLTAAGPRELGRPALYGTQAVAHETTPGGAQLRAVDVVTGEARVLRRVLGEQLLNPSVRDGVLLYVHASFEGQQLRTGRLGAASSGKQDRTVLELPPTARRDTGHEPGKERHDEGYPGEKAPALPPRPAKGITDTLWTTAIGADGLYASVVRQRRDGTAGARLLRTKR